MVRFWSSRIVPPPLGGGASFGDRASRGLGGGTGGTDHRDRGFAMCTMLWTLGLRMC